VGRESEIGESWGIAMTLLDKSLTVEGIMEQFHTFTRRFGFFGNFFSESVHRGVDFTEWLQDHLDGLVSRGWVVQNDGLYALTEEGRKAASKALAEVERTRKRVDTLATPENASRLTLIVHLFLAALKLPAGILSGSVGLLNDAIDTLLDGVSSHKGSAFQLRTGGFRFQGKYPVTEHGSRTLRRQRGAHPLLLRETHPKKASDRRTATRIDACRREETRL
jgi:hypothetical protein